MLRKLTVVWQRIELKQKLIIAGLFLGMVFSWGVAAWFIKYELDHPEPPSLPAPAYITDFLGILLVILFIICFSAEIYTQIRHHSSIHWFFKIFFVSSQVFILTYFLSAMPTIPSMVMVSSLIFTLYMINQGQHILFLEILKYRHKRVYDQIGKVKLV